MAVYDDWSPFDIDNLIARGKRYISPENIGHMHICHHRR